MMKSCPSVSPLPFQPPLLPASPVSLARHVSDRNDPHNTLALVPTLSAEDGPPVSPGTHVDDVYVDREAKVAYRWTGSGWSRLVAFGLPFVDSVVRMREKDGARLWHDVVLSRNILGQWTVEVAQDVGSETDGGYFDAEVRALGTTTARPLADRFSDVLNVKDFGAVGDGATDDHDAFQSWLDHLSANGGVGYVPKGSYRVSGELSCSRVNYTPGWNRPFTICGAGRNATTINSEATMHAFMFYGCVGIEIRDLTIDAGRETQEVCGNAGACVYCKDCSDFSFRSVGFVGFEYCGLIAYLTGNVEMVSKNWLVDGCVFDGTSCFNPDNVGVSGQDTYHGGLVLTSVSDSTVINTIARKCTGYGLEFKGYGGYPAGISRNCSFINCKTEMCNRGGFYFGGEGADGGDYEYLTRNALVSACESVNCRVNIFFGNVDGAVVDGCLSRVDSEYPFIGSPTNPVYISHSRNCCCEVGTVGFGGRALVLCKEGSTRCGFTVKTDTIPRSSNKPAFLSMDGTSSDCMATAECGSSVLTMRRVAVTGDYDYGSLAPTVIDVKAYGAKGDGVTDDTAAINAAITAAISKNASVHFPADTYLVSDNIEGLQQVTLVGDGSFKVGNSSYSISGDGNVVLYASPTMAEDPWDESPQGAQKHGSTDNDGLTVGTPCDLQTALDVAHRLPFFKGRITVNVLPGTYRGAYTVTNTRLLERMAIVGGQRDDGDCVSIIDGVGGSDSIAAQNLNGFTIRDSYVTVERILFKNWNGGTGVGGGDPCCGARSIESNSYFNDCDFYACGTGCYADKSRLYQGGGKVEECYNGTVVFGSSEGSLGYNGAATTYNAKTGSTQTVGITVRDCSSGVVDSGNFQSLRYGIKLMGGSIVRVSNCTFDKSTDSDVVLYTGASCYFGTGNVHTAEKRLKCFSAMDLDGSEQIYYDGNTQRFNFGVLKTPAYKFNFRAVGSITTLAPGATFGVDDNNPVIALNSDSESNVAGIRVAKPNVSGEASVIYDIINSRWRFYAGANWVASISSAGIVRGENLNASLGADSLRWKDVWTEHGSVEARLAALEAAVLPQQAQS